MTATRSISQNPAYDIRPSRPSCDPTCRYHWPCDQSRGYGHAATDAEVLPSGTFDPEPLYPPGVLSRHDQPGTPALGEHPLASGTCGPMTRPPSLRPRLRTGRGWRWSTPARCTRRSGSSGPGSCPICGMALEPVTVTADTGPSPELARHDPPVLGRRSRCPIPVLVLGHGRRPVPGDPRRRSPPKASAWIQLVLATPVVLWAGWPFFERGWTSVRTMKLNMFTLIAMGTGVAWLFSVVATVAPGIFPDAFRHGRHGRRLLRGRGRHHHPGPARAGARAARPRADLRCHPGAARPDPEDRAPHQRRRHRGGGGPRPGPDR